MSLRLVALLLLAGCPPKRPPEGPVGPFDAAEVLERARAAPFEAPVLATFDVKLATPSDRASANGLLLLDPDGRFRLELSGPIGGPAVIVACDGEELDAWQSGKNIFWTAGAVEEALRDASGGEAGLGAIATVFAGRLPADLGDPDATDTDGDGYPRYTWAGPDDSRLVAVLDPRNGRLRGLSAFDEDGKAWLRAELEPGDFPEHLSVELPVHGVQAELDFDAWKPASPTDAAFTLSPPPGAEIKKLELRRKGDAEPATGEPPPQVPVSTGDTPPAAPPSPPASPPTP